MNLEEKVYPSRTHVISVQFSSGKSTYFWSKDAKLDTEDIDPEGWEGAECCSNHDWTWRSNLAHQWPVLGGCYVTFGEITVGSSWGCHTDMSYLCACPTPCVKLHCGRPISSQLWVMRAFSWAVVSAFGYYRSSILCVAWVVLITTYWSGIPLTVSSGWAVITLPQWG